jgi:hypothetical protein
MPHRDGLVAAPADLLAIEKELDTSALAVPGYPTGLEGSLRVARPTVIGSVRSIEFVLPTQYLFGVLCGNRACRYAFGPFSCV